ncbi:hypothetical protein [Benzoatithermus flavus]|uniref:Uncharacterized protein n=1 Tax=Benzoatithermus flavus TaxID=3108223 RepID=A0ABU8XWU3_9PROT
MLRLVGQRRATLLLTPTLLLEYEAVCHLAEHRLASGLPAHDADRFLDVLALRQSP